MEQKFRIIVLLVIFVLSKNIFAGSTDSYTFSYITREQGLPDNNVNCIYKDSDGFIWFGTRNGLCRYDGYEIITYRNSNDPGSISGNRILDICEDFDGNLWIGTYNDGLNKFNKKTETFVRYNISNGIGQRVNRIKVFSDSTIWVCSSNGLAQINNTNNTFKLYINKIEDKNSIASDFVYDILETKSGEIYVSPEQSYLQKFDKERKSFENIYYKRDHRLQGNYNKRLLEDQNGLIWIAANTHGLCSYNPVKGNSEIYTSYNNHLSTNELMGQMDIDQEGLIWLSTEEEGINIFNTYSKTYEHLYKLDDTPGNLSSDHTYTIYFDNNNIVWIGTFDKGVNVYDPLRDKFSKSLFKPNDLYALRGSSVLDVFEDSRGWIWAGTDGNGLFLFKENNKIQHFTKENSGFLPTNVVTSIGELDGGDMLIGTYLAGLIRYNPINSEIIQYLPDGQTGSISSANIWDIYRDSHGRIWLALLGSGLDQYFPANGTFINHGPTASINKKVDFPNLMVIKENSEGDIWFGSEGKGVYIFDDQTQKSLRIEDTTYDIGVNGIIKCLSLDKWGNMWIGTEDNGLFQYNKTTGLITSYKGINGFDVFSIMSIEEDPYGNLWVGTTEGLFMYASQTQTFNHFITSDGLSSNQFNPNSVQLLRDGRIIIGSHNGADIISLDKIKLNQNLPRVILTKLFVLNHEISPGKIVNGRALLEKSITYTNELNLNWKDKIFTIEFAALNYTLPQKCNYRYKLEGFDKEWVNTPSTRRFASYSNLPNGQYIFKVEASNNDGKWGENGNSLIINVAPPFWETLFFKVLVLIVFVLFFYGIYRYRLNIHKEHFKQKQLDQERKIIALEKEQLEAELKKLAFSVLNKNRLLIEQKNKMLSLANKAKVSVREGLQKIVEIIDEDLDEEKDWKTIEPQVDKAYNQFITKLRTKHTDLTLTEVRIAAYIRMNLSTKEICELMHKTQRAVENDRYRLRKKIGLDSNDSIKNYLLNL